MSDLKFFSMVGLVGSFLLVLILGSCSALEENLDVSQEIDHRDYRYLDEVRINKGFYKDFTCVVTLERLHTVLCKVITHKDPDVVLEEKFRTNIEVLKSDITKTE